MRHSMWDGVVEDCSRRGNGSLPCLLEWAGVPWMAPLPLHSIRSAVPLLTASAILYIRLVSPDSVSQRGSLFMRGSQGLEAPALSASKRAGRPLCNSGLLLTTCSSVSA